MRWAYNDNGLIRIPVRCAPDGYYLRWYYNGWHYWFFLPGTHVIETEGERYRTLSRRKITVSSGQITRGQATAIRTIMNTREVYMWTDGGWAAIRIEPGSLKIYQSEVAGTEMEMTMIVGSREVTQTTGFSPVPPVPVVVPTYPWCEQVIGNQVWMCLNYDVGYPGSVVYDQSMENRENFGCLYSYDQINAPGFCPAGWRVPTIADWEELFTFVGAGEADKLKAAGTDYWSAGNAGTNAFGFQMRSTGRCRHYRRYVSYEYLMDRAYLWAIDSNAEDKVVLFQYDSADISYVEYHPLLYNGVRLIKDTPPAYGEVVYGYLYNWYAATDARNITSAGWHVPTTSDFLTLMLYLDPDGVSNNNTAGGALKVVGTTYWNTPNTGATNSTLFNGRGAGIRVGSTGAYAQIKSYLHLWNSTEYSSLFANRSSLYYNHNMLETTDGISGTQGNKHNGYAIRLIKETTTLTNGQTGTYTGNDGKVYSTIVIGGKEWLSENLCETLYRNGDPIPEVTPNAAWAALSTGARCSYNNDESNAHA